MKQKLVNFLKYNKVAYAIYFRVMSFCINVLKLFIKTDDKLILFNSFAGRKFDDSPKTIYEVMKADPRFEGYKLVWAFHEPDKYDVPQKIKTDGFRYFQTALAARVWLTNSSVERGLNFKGKNTLYFNTWHGTPIKRIGSDLSKSNESFGNKEREKLSSFDIMCSQGNYESKIYSRAFNIPIDRFLESGLPRNDVLANYSIAQKQEIRERLSIDTNKTVILYCPTFREFEKDGSLNVVLKPPMDLDYWNKQLGENFILLFRAHYEVSKIMGVQGNEFVRNVTDYPSLNELIIASDLLISDYSSVFFDYSITGKPMLHFCYDYEKYAAKRGMYFDVRAYIDGADNEKALIERILHINLKEQEKKTKAFRERFIDYYGSAAEKCVACIAERLQLK